MSDSATTTLQSAISSPRNNAYELHMKTLLNHKLDSTRFTKQNELH